MVDKRCKRDLQTIANPSDLFLLRPAQQEIYNEIVFSDLENSISIANIIIPQQGVFDEFVRTNPVLPVQVVNGILNVDQIFIDGNKIYSDPSVSLELESNQSVNIIGGDHTTFYAGSLTFPFVRFDSANQNVGIRTIIPPDPFYALEAAGNLNISGTGVNYYINGVPITGPPGGAQGNIQIQDDGIDLGTPGQFLTYNFTGPGVSVTDAGGNVLDIDITGGGGGGQVPIQWRNEGIDLGVPGQPTIINLTGNQITGNLAGNILTISVADQNASEVSYDNTSTGVTATTVQEVVDDLIERAYGLSFPYFYRGVTTNPNVGEFGTDNLDWSLVTRFYINATALQGINLTLILNSTSRKRILVQLNGNNDGGKRWFIRRSAEGFFAPNVVEWIVEYITENNLPLLVGDRCEIGNFNTGDITTRNISSTSILDFDEDESPDGLTRVDASGGNIDINLLTPAGIPNRSGTTFKRIDNNQSATVTLIPALGDTIEDLGQFTIRPKESFTIIYDTANANWDVI